MMRWMLLTALAFVATLAGASALEDSDNTSLAALATAERAARQASDSAAVATYRAGLARTVAYVRAHPGIFPVVRSAGARLLTAAERDAARSAWKSMLDYTLALDSLEAFHTDFFLVVDARERARSFHIANNAFRATYRFALDFIGIVENDPKLGIILNDAVDDLGLPAGTYDRYKLRFLNVTAATRFAAYTIAGKAIDPPANAAQARDGGEDAAIILAAGRGRVEALTAANALNVLRKIGARAIFPAQAGISEWMGDTKVLRRKRSLISPTQVEALGRQLLPGDIMLQRREWYVSNVGLPGFWSHAALSVGTAEERRVFFGTDEVRRWVESRGEASGDFERLLEHKYPVAYEASRTPREHGRQPRVLEAISEGVLFTTLEHSADADSVVVLRPRLDRVAIAAALERAWAYFGRPYDFNFDFQTDSAIVCTELIFKAFEPSAQIAGLHFRLEEILGRTAIPANAIARQFHEEHGTPAAKLDFIAFLDGQEKAGVAVEAGVAEFRSSWRRPKWHVLVQDAASAPDVTR